MNVTIQVNARAAAEELGVTTNTVRQAVVRALNDTLRETQADAASRLSARLGITRPIAERYTRIERATPETLESTLSIRDLYVAARRLSPVQTATGVRYSVPGVVEGELRHAFLATLRRGGTGGGGAGHVGVFRRASRPAKRRGRNRSYLPIRQQVVRVPAHLPAGLVDAARTRLVALVNASLARLDARPRRAA